MNLWEDWNLLQSKSEKSMSGNPEKKPFFDKTSLPRTILGGAAMGIANIIPGVSGGTMVLAFGLYEKFVNSVAAVTRFKFTLPVISFLCIFGVSAVIAIFTSADVITWGLTYHQHIMFALFIGLTLGGVPTLCREMGRFTGLGTGTAMAGFISILVINSALSEIDLPANFLFLFLGGIIGSAAMVLPGISGSYLLLILGLYIPMTEGIHDFKEALKAVDVGAMMGPAFGVILPVGLGVLTGIAGLSNVLNILFAKFRIGTLGYLLGLLLGSVITLYPFREPGRKDPFGAAAEITSGNVIIVLVCVVLGFATTRAIDLLAKEQPLHD